MGTDGVVLGALCSVGEASQILEAGTGTGLISLMIAQRNKQAEILALDISVDAVKLATQNFNQSPFHARMKAMKADFSTWNTIRKYDLIVCNPPYFEPNTSQKDRLARQQIGLTYEVLIRKAAEHLVPGGLLSVIIPFIDQQKFVQNTANHGLQLQRAVHIYGRKGSAPKRAIMEFGFGSKESEISTLTIEAAPRIFTKEYLELTADFHVFTSTSAD